MLCSIGQIEGTQGLYRGLFPVLESLCLSNFVYFYTFHTLKSLQSKDDQSVWRDLVFGMVAGAINVLTTTPCWVVNTRLKMKSMTSSTIPYTNLRDGIVHVAKHEGIQGLWAGTIPSLILVINPAIQFMVYEAIKREVLKSYKNIPSLAVFGMASIAKICATVITYPLQLIQTKLRHGLNKETEAKHLPKNPGTFAVGLFILRTYGPLGLFRGIEAKLAQTVLTAALMFVAYEKIFKLVVTILRANKN